MTRNRQSILLVAVLLGGLFAGPAAGEEEPTYPTLTLWPLAYHRAGTESSYTDILWPLIHHERHKTLTLFRIRPGLFAVSSDPARSYRSIDVLWPLTRFERDGAEHWNHLFPFFWEGEADQHRWFHLWPLYGLDQRADGTRRYSTIFPLFGYSVNAQSGDWSVDYLWPLGHAYRNESTSGSRLLPLWWQRRSETSAGGFVFPYYWYDAPQSSWRGVLPVWFWRQTPELHFSLLVPLYLERKSAASRLLVFFPGGCYYRDDRSSASGLLPLWFRLQSPGTRFTLLLPIYLDEQTATGRLLVVIPGYFDIRDGNDSTRGLIPFWLQRQAGAEELIAVAPVYLQRRDTRSTTTLLLPVWASGQGATWRFATFAPFYWGGRAPTGELRVVLPLHLYAADAGAETSVWPLYYRYQDRQAGSELRYYFPVYGRYTLGDRVFRHYLLFPLYSHYVDREQNRQSWNALWPIFHLEQAPASFESWILPLYWWTQGPEGGSRMALGLYWARHWGAEEWSLLAPLWWQSRFAGTKTRVLAPFYVDHERPDGWRRQFFLGPLAIASRQPQGAGESLDLLWPLVSHERSAVRAHDRLLPFYWRTATAEQTLTVASPALLPPYYLHRKTPLAESYHLWPFYGWHRAGEEQGISILWPLIGSNRAPQRRHSHALPFYWHTAIPERKLTVATPALLPPFYLHLRTQDGELRQLWPFYGTWRDDDYREFNTLWPLVRWGTDPAGSRRTHQFVLYYDLLRDSRHRAGFFPLYHHWSSGTASDTVSLLHWSRSDSETRQISLFHLGHPDVSLFSDRHSGTRSHQHLFPLYSSNSDAATDTRSITLLGPLYHYRRQGETLRSWNVLWKVAYVEHAQGLDESGFFWRLARSRVEPAHELLEINPLYYRERRPGDEFSAWLGGIYSTHRQGDATRRCLFWGGCWRSGGTGGTGAVVGAE